METKKLYSSITDSINELVDFISKSRHKNSTQISIVTNRILDSIAKDYIYLESKETLYSPKIADLSSLAILKFQEISNLLPDLDELAITQLQVDTEYIIWLKRFAETQLHVGNRRLEASANMLIQLLAGIPEFNSITPFINNGYSHLKIIANALYSVISLYRITITVVDTMIVSDFLQFANKAFKHIKLFQQLFDKFRWETMYLERQNDADVADIVYIVFSTIRESVLLCSQLLKVFGTTMHNRLNTYGLMSSNDFVGFMQYIEETNLKIISTMNILTNLYISNQMGLNDRVEQDIKYQVLKGLSEFLRDFIRAHKNQYLLFSEGINTNQFTSLLQLKKKTLESMAQNGLASYIFQSDTAVYYSVVFMDYVALLAYTSVYFDIVENFELEIGRLYLEVRSLNEDAFPEVAYVLELATLYVATYNGDTIVLASIRAKLNDLMRKFLFRPRFAASICLLANLIGFYLDLPSNNDEFLKQQIDALRTLGKNYLAENILQYMAEMEKSMQTGEEGFFKPRKLNPFDYYSWLIPDFSKIAKQTNKVHIPFIPYNLSLDGILTKSDEYYFDA